MRLARCSYNGSVFTALVEEDVLALLDPKAGCVAKLLANRASLADVSAHALQRVRLDSVEFLPPIENPDKILCVGVNFPMHLAETGVDYLPYPTLFTRFASSQVGHLAPIMMPRASVQFDFEGELAVVIGKAGRNITEDEARHVIGGYTCFADNSLRDYQAHTRQVTPGKNFYKSGAIGPWVVTADEIACLDRLTIATRLNGVEVQRAQLGEMIYGVPAVLSYISRFTALFPGDIVAMGTPPGIGAMRDPPLWMRPRDVLEVEIDQIGTLRNAIES